MDVGLGAQRNIHTSKRLLAGRNQRVDHIVRVSVNLWHVLAEYVEYKEVHRVN